MGKSLTLTKADAQMLKSAPRVLEFIRADARKIERQKTKFEHWNDLLNIQHNMRNHNQIMITDDIMDSELDGARAGDEQSLAKLGEISQVKGRLVKAGNEIGSADKPGGAQERGPLVSINFDTSTIENMKKRVNDVINKPNNVIEIEGDTTCSVEGNDK